MSLLCWLYIIYVNNHVCTQILPTIFRSLLGHKRVSACAPSYWLWCFACIGFFLICLVWMLKNKWEPWLWLNKLMWQLKLLISKIRRDKLTRCSGLSVSGNSVYITYVHRTPQLYPVSNSFESFISHRVGGSLATFLNFLWLQLTCPIMLIVSQGSQTSIEIRCVI